MSRLPGVLILLALVSSFVTGNAWSEEKGAVREREALRRVQQQVQQLRQEKTALEAKLASFEQEKATLGQERDKLVSGAQARAKSESVKREQLQLALDAMTQEKQAQKGEFDQRLTELTTKQTNTDRELAKTLAQRKQADSMIVARDQQVASCQEKNVMLYRHGRDLIEQCRDRSATDAVLRLEPFTGIKKVAIENLLEEYRDKLDAGKVSSTENRK